MVMIANNTFKATHNIVLQANAISMNGKDSLLTQVFVETASTKPVPRAPRFRPPVQQKKQE
jgi:hypothetical protein